MAEQQTDTLDTALDAARQAHSETSDQYGALMRERAARDIEAEFPGAQLVELRAFDDDMGEFRLAIVKITSADGTVLYDEEEDDPPTVIEDYLTGWGELHGPELFDDSTMLDLREDRLAELG